MTSTPPTRRVGRSGLLVSAEATLGWFLANPGVSSVIAGATSPEQVRANAAAATAWTPTPDDLAEIDGILPLPADPAAG